MLLLSCPAWCTCHSHPRPVCLRGWHNDTKTVTQSTVSSGWWADMRSISSHYELMRGRWPNGDLQKHHQDIAQNSKRSNEAPKKSLDLQGCSRCKQTRYYIIDLLFWIIESLSFSLCLSLSFHEWNVQSNCDIQIFSHWDSGTFSLWQWYKHERNSR